jgi:hypothetical protein
MNTNQYKSLQVSSTAKERVVALSKVLKLTQRDTASKLISEWRDIPPFVGYLLPNNYNQMTPEGKLSIIQDELNSALRWIDSVNNPQI